MKQNGEKFLPGILLIVFFFITFFAYNKLAGPMPFAVNSVTTTKTDTFSVTGEGKTIIKPDMALVNVGIESNGPTVKHVQNQINMTINKIASALKNLGINENDIRTINYNINPNYDWGNGRQRIVSFSAGTTLEIKVRDIDRINEVIDASTANGANTVSNISFDVEDKAKAEEEARKEAVAEAKKKAQAAAQIAGFKLGRIINYSESSAGDQKPIVYRQALKLGAGTESTQVEPGSSEIKIIVTLSYEIE